MTTDVRAERVVLALYPWHDKQLDKIAHHLGQERGQRFSRSAAIRLMIEGFILPAGLPERTIPAEPPEQTAA